MIISNISQCRSLRFLKYRSIHNTILPVLTRNCSNSSDNYWINSINTEEVEINLKDKRILKISTGKYARFADGAAIVSLGDTNVMMTAVSRSKSEINSFLPLTVDYRQKAAAAGRIPTNYLRREIGVSENEILTSRMIDRSVRPLFPASYLYDTQLISNVMSMDGENNSDVLAINAASAALALSDIPWDGPIGAVRVGYVDGDVVINPTRSQLLNSDLDLIVTGCAGNKVVMLEGSADNLDQPTFMSAIKSGVKATNSIVDGIETLAKLAGRTKREWTPDSGVITAEQKTIVEAIRSLASSRLREVFMDETHHKFSRDRASQAIREDVITLVTGYYATLRAEDHRVPSVMIVRVLESYPECNRNFISTQFSSLLKSTFRELIFENKSRCDGRSLFDLRPISCEVDLYRPLHGSSMFQRGQTQVLGTVTYDSLESAAKVDSISSLMSVNQKNFFLHYEFPPYATNETGKAGGAGRRELGHGALAEKALRPVVPSESPFTVRVTAEVLESNGSSSMASVCAGSLALMDAGVAISDAVAGIAIGLVTKEDDTSEYLILTDILGIEDYLGDMDFKMAGTKNGITALQADIKLTGLPLNIIMEAVQRATEGKKKILNIMNDTLRSPRTNKGEEMPISEKLTVAPQKRGQFLGIGGNNLRRLKNETGVTITHIDGNDFQIFAPNQNAYKEATDKIDELLNTETEPQLEFGSIYKARVTEIRENGVLVELYDGMSPALIPNSQLDQRKVSHASALDIVVGQDLSVKYFGRDPASGRLRLSRKALFGSSSIARDLMRKP